MRMLLVEDKLSAEDIVPALRNQIAQVWAHWIGRVSTVPSWAELSKQPEPVQLKLRLALLQAQVVAMPKASQVPIERAEVSAKVGEVVRAGVVQLVHYFLT